MATLASTVTRICDDLSRPEDEIGGVVEREILSAISHYASTRFGFNERVISTTLSATTSYSFGALLANTTDVEDILKVDQVKVTVNGSRTLTLEEENWTRLNAIDQMNLTSGNPDFYAIYNRVMMVYPTPNIELPTEIAAHVLLPTLTSGDENAWLTEGEELIRSRACRMVCASKLDDFEKAQMFMVLEGEALRELARRGALVQSTGILSPND